MAETLRWWLVLQGAGLLALPITLTLFRFLPGRGYAFAKPLGLLLGGYLFWLALSLHVLPNRPGSVVWVYLLIAAASSLIVRRRGAELGRDLARRWFLVLAVEAVFTLALFSAAHVRSFIPEIAGTEKPMDFMMLNAAARDRYYPPEDPWLAGEGVSYYYFGYVLQAMVAKLAFVPASVAFNLGVAGSVALAATAAFGLGYEMARLVRGFSRQLALAAGLAAVLLVLVIGNLQGVLEFAAANDALSDDLVKRIDIANLEQARSSDACLVPLPGGCIAYPTEESSFWWWWRATRISPDGGSITEFPFFSFILGDLHPHFMAVPFVLMATGIGITFWRSPQAPSFDTWRRNPALLLLCAALIGGLGFLNTWDLPTFFFVIALLVVARCLLSQERVGDAVLQAAGFLLPLAVLAALLYAPFYVSFSSQARGLEAVTGGATRPLHFFLLWAPLFLVNLPLPLGLLASEPAARARGRVLLACLLPLLLLLLWAIAVLAGGSSLADAIADRGWNWLSAAAAGACLVVTLLALWRAIEQRRAATQAPATQADDAGGQPDYTSAAVVALAAAATGFLLVLGAELFFIQDVFGTRLNTVFKLSYQAWLLLGVSGGFGLVWLAERIWPRAGVPASLPRAALVSTIAVVLAAASLYPLSALLSRTEGLAREGRTLDGLAWLRRDAPDDYAAIAWLRDRADGDDRIVEAVGGQYSSAGRIAGSTGVPTVLGWPGHEQQWGRDYGEIALRQNDIDRAYNTPSLEEALIILRKYRVTYVIVGRVERQTYPPAGLDKFASGLPSVFSSGQTTIFRVPVAGPGESLGRAE